ncbi:MAG TPA: hypothetical protein VMX75_05075, partial [Spirochaetia bacterium]|nr:hypothetical protein [Spirochaetia bacterium]
MEPLIDILPEWLNLDYFSIVRVSSLILSLSISVYLFRLRGRSVVSLMLAWAFLGASLFNLAMVLEFASPCYWQPWNWKNHVWPYLLVASSSITTISFLLFAYH